MNCTQAREKILQSEKPTRPGAGPAEHLEGCPPCRSWLRRLARLERSLAQLPVEVPPIPPALRAEREPAPLVCPRLYQPLDRRESARRKLALASSLAAALLLFALGLWAWPYLGGGGAPSALAEYQARRDAVLSPLRAPGDRLLALAGLADTLLDEALEHPQAAERRASQVEELARADLPRLARSATAEVVQEALLRLSRTESRASRLAAAEADPRLARALTRISASAREADRRLRQLAA
jgi:hypothetical protein